MTVLHTLAKRQPDPAEALHQALETRRRGPDADLANMLFPSALSPP